MKTYTIEIEDSVSEFLEEVAAIMAKPVESVICDALFLHTDHAREKLVAEFTVDADM